VRVEARTDMGPIDPEAASKFQPELSSGESLLWAGRPNPKVIFHSDDWYLFPFSLLWVGFTTFWEMGALGYWGNNSKGPSLFMVLWGVPFILIGHYMLWGRFLYDGWLKRRTYYGVTSRRILVVQEAWSRKTGFHYIDVLPTIEREGTFTGTLWLGPKYAVLAGRGQRTRDMSRFRVGDPPVFADIDDVESVYRLVRDLREQLTQRNPTFVR
jgi:hypothetical protein